MQKNILILGSGGRECVITRQLLATGVDKVFVAPGNAGTAQLAENIDIKPSLENFEKIASIVIEKEINMIIVGPEDPLANGVVDFFKNDPVLMDVLIFGPDKEAAQLESDKDYANRFMLEFGIPTAAFQSFTIENLEEGYDYIRKYFINYKKSIVLKASGLAAGKGVLIIDNEQEACDELKLMLEGKFGQASKKVVIEEFLDGIEFSVFALTDGETRKLLPNAKDYKRIGQGDTGLNTGGMGCITPVPFVDKELMDKVEERMIKRTMKGIKARNLYYRGVLYFGLINVNGNPYMIEYNIRFGDPEAQIIIPMIDGDFYDLLAGTCQGNLISKNCSIKPGYGSIVVVASGGYPEKYEKGKIIKGLENVVGSNIDHAGTILDQDGNVLTNGGRVLGMTSFSEISLQDALQKSYDNIKRIDFEGKTIREDIGYEFV